MYGRSLVVISPVGSDKSLSQTDRQTDRQKQTYFFPNPPTPTPPPPHPGLS